MFILNTLLYFSDFRKSQNKLEKNHFNLLGLWIKDKMKEKEVI
jgi:hypothetical protein